MLRKVLLALGTLALLVVPLGTVQADHGTFWRGCPPAPCRPTVCSRCGFAPCRCHRVFYDPYFGGPYGARFNYYYRYGCGPSFYFGTFGPRGGFYFGF
ncbi:MAG: hypothetical protein KatS3mg110_1004 [Pirellulaceae bacterium]|nr:MAG: hypothetical protein KatS3mg110_1004 [Pirellulaceae bacterium]